MSECERILRELDATVQEWMLVHGRSTSAASRLLNLHDQATKTQGQLTADSGNLPKQRLRLLLAIQIDEIEAILSGLRQHVHDYARVVRQLESLDQQVNRHALADDSGQGGGVDRVAGITPDYVVAAVRDRKAQYVKEYVRRRGLIEDLVLREKISTAQFATEWVEAKIDYATEEDYLERLRLARLARQWQANCAEDRLMGSSKAA
ncbi:hypothetical protein GGI04_003596 [Coemansia thaxteri]|uniref:Uncharacterized protein n=1 Tax=Coemansia thaxteri TaxID=2663907 RepID=A0A9W8BNL4_9FUNG|nr:hypothetical protein GGI04_003596 [Coemansia thaxteri]KAJ2007999.1 hypothetical protein H4R26_000433 [Coemansia thaxteri]KAJ2467073.1 hypothetical protein GGI02_004159 [Coemansia sp. RSA 2322]KAJ2480833.1 hypothetical protein EV174_003622 [Coemansia sp. RSA 2320]